jgi:hypothetical protein
MTTSREELTTTATLYQWEVLKSPAPNEVIYRRDPMVVFVQYDRAGQLREAVLRRVIGRGLTTVVKQVGWTDHWKLTVVSAWFAHHGDKSDADQATMRARRKAVAGR